MRLLLILSQYRISEKILPVIPELKKEFDLDCLLVYQMKSNHKWPGDRDLRKEFYKNYKDYFNIITENRNHFDYGSYDLIISDDNRNTPKTGLNEIYEKKNFTYWSWSNWRNTRAFDCHKRISRCCTF